MHNVFLNVADRTDYVLKHRFHRVCCLESWEEFSGRLRIIDESEPEVLFLFQVEVRRDQIQKFTGQQLRLRINKNDSGE